MASVTFTDICKSFGKVSIVKNLNLDVLDKEFLVLVGPSGCGKSTSLRMLAGLESPTSGTIAIGDTVVNDLDPKDRNIAMVFQNYALYPHLNVYDNLAFGLKMQKVPSAITERKVNEVAKNLNIAHLLLRKPKELSGGQRQRVALGRAIVREPAVFLMDEPLSNLDAKLRVQMRAELIALQNRLETTTIYVTHDQTEAMTMGHRIVVMKEGIVQQIAAPQVIYDHPANMFVASFIGSPPINFLTANVLTSDGGITLRTAGTEYAATANCGFLQSYIGKTVTIGIRPEALRLAPAAESCAAVQGQVIMAETLGSEILVHVDIQGEKVIVKENSGMVVRPGENVTLFFPVDCIRYFDQASEKAIRVAL